MYEERKKAIQADEERRYKQQEQCFYCTGKRLYADVIGCKTYTPSDDYTCIYRFVVENDLAKLKEGRTDLTFSALEEIARRDTEEIVAEQNIRSVLK